ncbi:MAG: hypothetical protein COA79_02435 [Planctomycetota bacterium]|nr:MAG: hypothetical protein COA79_02435 [Planctomycetota bacterium]
MISMIPDIEKIFIYWLNELEKGKELPWQTYISKYPQYEKELTKYFQTYLKLNNYFFEDFPDIVPDLNQYEIIEKIGEGGMGAVYKATDTNLNRTVAVKASLPLKGSDELNEARSMARLQHQNIVQVFDLLKVGYKNYIVMELVEGVTLEKKSKELDYDKIAKIFYQLCDALAYAHDKGVVHRDLKPQNILITAELNPKIVDFGLAEDLDESNSNQMKSVKGTPVFTAPEIMSGETAYTNCVDIYSLGICLYFSLTGRLPFEFTNMEDLLNKIKSHQFELPRAIKSNIPEPLQAIALKAMEANPDNRYSSASTMLDDLHKFLSKEVIDTKPAVYQIQLNELVSTHQAELDEWEKQSLISREEKESLLSRYDLLLAKEDDWVLENRKLSFSQNSLYLGVWLAIIGSVLMFYALFYPHGQQDNSGQNILSPLIILFTASICGIAGFFFWNEKKFRIGLSFLLVFIYTMPLALLGFFKGFNWFHNPVQLEYELFEETLWVSNLQLFQSFFFTSVIGFVVNLKVKTRGTSFALGLNVFICFIFGLVLFGLLKDILNEKEIWFRSCLLIFSLICFIFAFTDEYKRQLSIAGTFYWLFLISLLLGLNAWAYDGVLFDCLNLSLDSYYYPSLTTAKIKTLHHGLLLIVVSFFCLIFGNLLQRLNTKLSFRFGRILNFIVPYFLLFPLAFLSNGFDFGFHFDVAHLVASLIIIYASIWLQRKNYFYTGLLNVGTFIVIYSIDYELLEKFSWSRVIVIMGVCFLLLGAVPISKIKKKIKIT